MIGINGVGYESANSLAVSGRTLPWLQDTAQEQVWQKWGVLYRDVIILDGANVPVAVFNLSSYDLANPTNYDSLKTLLRGIAEAE